MIDFNYETEFSIDNREVISEWISNVISAEEFKEGELNYVFCDDEYLNKLNVEFLSHDTFTDIISFDYTMGKLVSGDIFISVDRVRENAVKYDVSFEEELHRVIVHGVLHYCGYKDKSDEDAKVMRARENHYLGAL